MPRYLNRRFGPENTVDTVLVSGVSGGYPHKAFFCLRETCKRNDRCEVKSVGLLREP